MVKERDMEDATTECEQCWVGVLHPVPPDRWHEARRIPQFPAPIAAAAISVAAAGSSP